MHHGRDGGHHLRRRVRFLTRLGAGVGVEVPMLYAKRMEQACIPTVERLPRPPRRRWAPPNPTPEQVIMPWLSDYDD